MYGFRAPPLTVSSLCVVQVEWLDEHGPTEDNQAEHAFMRHVRLLIHSLTNRPHPQVSSRTSSETCGHLLFLYTCFVGFRTGEEDKIKGGRNLGMEQIPQPCEELLTLHCHNINPEVRLRCNQLAAFLGVWGGVKIHSFQAYVQGHAHPKMIGPSQIGAEEPDWWNVFSVYGIQANVL